MGRRCLRPGRAALSGIGAGASIGAWSPNKACSHGGNRAAGGDCHDLVGPEIPVAYPSRPGGDRVRTGPHPPARASRSGSSRASRPTGGVRLGLLERPLALSLGPAGDPEPGDLSCHSGSTRTSLPNGARSATGPGGRTAQAPRRAASMVRPSPTEPNVSPSTTRAAGKAAVRAARRCGRPVEPPVRNRASIRSGASAALGEAAPDPGRHRPGEVAGLRGPACRDRPAPKARVPRARDRGPSRPVPRPRSWRPSTAPARAWPRSPSTASRSRATRSGRAQSRITSSISRRVF